MNGRIYPANRDKTGKAAKKAAALLLSCYIFGCLAGCLAAYKISPAALENIKREVASFAVAAGRGASAYDIFWTAAQCVSPVLLVALLGCGPYGTVGIPAVFAWQGACAAYSVTALYRLPDVGKGLLLAAALYGGRCLVQTLSVVAARSEGYARAVSLRKNAAGVLPPGEYAARAALSAVPALLAVLWELAVTPRLLSAVNFI